MQGGADSQASKAPIAKKSSTTAGVAPEVERKWAVGKKSVEKIPKSATSGLGVKIEERDNGTVYIIRTTKGSSSERVLGSTRFLGPQGLRILKVDGQTFDDKTSCVALIKGTTSDAVRFEVVLERVVGDIGKPSKTTGSVKGSTQKVKKKLSKKEKKQSVKKSQSASSTTAAAPKTQAKQPILEREKGTTPKQIEMGLMNAVDSESGHDQGPTGGPRLLPIGRANGQFGFELRTELLSSDEAGSVDTFQHSIKVVSPRGPAELVGLAVGDLVLEVDGHETESMSVTSITAAFSAIVDRPAWLLVCPATWAAPATLEQTRADLDRFSPADSVMIPRNDESAINETIRRLQVDAAKAQMKHARTAEIEKRRSAYQGEDVAVAERWEAASHFKLQLGKGAAIVERTIGQANLPSVEPSACVLDDIVVRCIGHNLTVTAPFTHEECDKLRFSAVLVQTRGCAVIDKVLECQRVKARACIVGHHACGVEVFALQQTDDPRWADVKIPVFLVGTLVFFEWVTAAIKEDTVRLVSARSCAIPTPVDEKDVVVEVAATSTPRKSKTSEQYDVSDDSEPEDVPPDAVAVEKEVEASTSSDALPDGTFELRLSKPPGTKWGLKLRPVNGGVLIKESPAPGTPAAEGGRIQGGMVLHTLNGVSTVGMTKEALKTHIAADVMVLVLPLADPEAASVESTAVPEAAVEPTSTESVPRVQYGSMRRKELVSVLRKRGVDYRDCKNAEELTALAIATDPGDDLLPDESEPFVAFADALTFEVPTESPQSAPHRDSNPFADADVVTSEVPAESPRSAPHRDSNPFADFLLSPDDAASSPMAVEAAAPAAASSSSQYEGMRRLAIIKVLRSRDVDYSACRNVDELRALAISTDTSSGSLEPAPPPLSMTPVAPAPSDYDSLGRLAIIKILRARDVDYSACVNVDELRALAVATDSSASATVPEPTVPGVLMMASEADLDALDD